MVALYITSVESAGKTALCGGIGKKLISDGKKVGYIVPARLSEAGNSDGYRSIAFIKKAFGLVEPDDMLCPIELSQGDLWQNLTDGVEKFSQRIKQVYNQISSEKDVVLMEGLSNLIVDKVSTLACYTIAEILDAKVIIMLRYSPTLDLTEITQISEKLGQRLLGVVVNFAPEARIEVVKHGVIASFQNVGIKVLGVLPEVQGLSGVSIGELAETLSGEILNDREKNNEIVESVMLGAMGLDSGIDYFSRKANKAAVIRGERADMQLAALETSTRCLILTNDLKPLPAVASQAEDKHIPILTVKQDTSATVAGIEEALAKTTFYDTQKLKKFENMLDQYFDFETFYSELG